MALTQVQQKMNSLNSFVGTITVTLDTPATAGNLLVLVLGADKGPGTYTLPTGFTAIQQYNTDPDVDGIIAYKIATGGESGLTCSWTNTTVSKPTLIVIEYSGNTATPLGNSDKNTSGATVVLSRTTQTIVTSKASSDVIAVAISDSATSGWSTTRSWNNSFVEVANGGSAATGPAAVSVAKKTIDSSGASVSSTFSWSGTGDQVLTFIVEFETTAVVPPSAAPVRLVQKVHNSTNTFSPSITINFPQNATAGNLILLALAVDKAHGAITLPSGFTLVQEDTQGNGVGGAVAYKVADGSEHTFTCSWANPSVSKPSIIVLEYDGFTGTPLHTSNKAGFTTSAVTSQASGSVTVSLANTTVFAFNFIDSADTGWAGHSWSDTFVEIDNIWFGSSAGVAVAARNYTSTVTVNPTLSYTGTSDQMGGITVVFLQDGSEFGVNPAATTSKWVAVGKVTTTSGQVSLAPNADCLAFVSIYALPENTIIRNTSLVLSSGSVLLNHAKVDLTGLSPNTTYKYVPVLNWSEDTSNSGKFTTFPVAEQGTSFRFAHYSCNQNANSTTFTRLRAKSPILMVNMGDWNYADINSTNSGNYLPGISGQYSSANQKAVYQEMAFARVWDDHDFCGNDSLGTAAGAGAAQLMFRAFTPHYDLPDVVNSGSIYQAFTVGALRFIMMDLRSEHTTFQMMSTGQMQWIKDQIVDARNSGEAVCLVSALPWISSESASQNWGDNACTGQRYELATFIRQAQMGRSTFLVHGDAHMLAYDNGTNNGYGFGGGENFKVFCGAALERSSSVKGGPYSSGTLGGSGQYAIVDVSHSGTYLQVNWKGYRSTDAIWGDNTFTLQLPKTSKQRVTII